MSRSKFDLTFMRYFNQTITFYFALFCLTFFGSTKVLGAGPYGFLLTAGYPQPTAFTWTGKSGDGNFNTAGNWWGGVVPGSSNVANFDYHYCSTHCNVTINANINVLGITINSFYPGTITQSTGKTITIGASGWTQKGGTFIGSVSGDAITVNGSFILTSGVYTATSGTLTIAQPFSTDGQTKTVFTFSSSATFNHGSGTVTFAGVGSAWLNVTANFNIPATGITFYDVVVNPTSYNNSAMFGPTSNSVTVSHSLTHSQGKLIGNWNLTGNFIVNNTANGGSGTITMNGTSAQTYKGLASGAMTANLVISNTAGVTEAAGSTGLAMQTFSLAQGSFAAPAGNMSILYYLFAGDNQTATIFTVASGTTFTAGTGTVTFAGVGSSCLNETLNFNIPASGVTFYDVVVNPISYNNSAMFGPTSNSVTVSNSLTHSQGKLIGNWNLTGNLIVNSTANGGSGTITMDGTSAQTYKGLASGAMTANLVISNSAGVTEAAGSTGLAMQSFSLAQGSFAAPAGNMSILYYLFAGDNQTATIFTVASGATFTAGTGTVTFAGVGSTWVNATVNFNIPASGVTFYDVVVNPTSYSNSAMVGPTSNAVTVSHSLTHSQGKLIGNWNLTGNLIVNNTANGGSGTITFGGTGMNTINISSGTPTTGNITINKSGGGSVTLGTNVSFVGSSQVFTVSGGSVDMATYSLSLKSLVLSGNTLTKNGGTLTVNGSVAGVGTLYGGTVNP